MNSENSRKIDPDYEKKFEDSMKNIIWANQYEQMTKRELWILKESEKNELSTFYNEQIKDLEFKAKREINDLEVKSGAKKIFWLIVGGIIGGSTNLFDL